MRIETSLGTVLFVGGVAFILGAQYGYHKTRERFFTQIANTLAEEIIKPDSKRT